MKKYRVIGNTSRHGFSIGEIVTKISIDTFSNGNDCWYMDYREVEQIKKEKPMKLKAGKYYKTRDGRVVGRVKNDPYPDSFYKFMCEGYYYSEYGEGQPNGDVSDYDLISRHHKSPSKKKLMRVIKDVLEGGDYSKAEKILKKWGDQC